MKTKGIKEKSKMEKLLSELGFPERQADVYLALLELGRGTVSQIARASGINRTTGYDILDNLVDKGLVSISGREPKQEYVAEPPQQLAVYIGKEAEKATGRVELAADLIPELASIHNVYGRPKVMFYEDKDGLERVYEDTLTSHETILAYANVEDTNSTLPDYFPLYYKRRAAKGIPIRAIFPADKAAFERATQDANEARETAIVPADEYFFSPEINIYDDKIMIASWREKLGIIIQSREIAEAMKSIYKLAWAEAKRVDVRKKNGNEQSV